MIELIKSLLMKSYCVTLTDRKRVDNYNEERIFIRAWTPWQAIIAANEASERSGKAIWEIRRLT